MRSSLPSRQLFCISILSLPAGHVNHARNNSQFHPDCKVLVHLHRPLLALIILNPDQYEYRRKINTYYPFHDEGEWELARFLVENLTQTQIDKFLKLKWFHTRPRPSFTSKDQLLDWIDVLPSFVPWKVSTMEFTGYKMTYPLQLIWCDALEVVKQLFSDPVFANHITFHLHVVNTGGQHEYGDYMSTDMAWKIQVNSIYHLPVGATQVPIILGSDKTPVTCTTGGLEMHPLFITIGNLDSEVCSKATLRAWCCIAYMPIAKFHVHPDCQSILQACLWHRCVDLICANLKVAAKNGCFMPYPSQYICYVFTPIVSHEVDPWDLDKFQKAAKAVHLSGVHMPYWHDWTFACPSVFLTGEFFVDHPLNWIKETVGKPELNARFMVQHKWVGTRHFTKDIQCIIVALIAGTAPPRFICSICALIEFIYLSQNPVHSPDSLQLMVQALSDFHLFKNAIVDTETIFFIPKLELLQSFRGMVMKMGRLMQFSADITERLLITHCKHLFERTNRRSTDFTEQCIRILNHQESMELCNLYALFYSRGASLVNAIHIEDEEVTTINPALSSISRVLPDETHSVHGPRPVRNHFLKGILSGDALTAFHLTLTPDFNALTPITIEAKYSLFINQLSLSTGEHTCWDHGYGHFCTWNEFQLHRVIQAYPPSDAFPLRNCNTVLINVMGSDSQSMERTYMIDQCGRHCRCGGVVSLTDVTHAVELIPEYGNKVDERISSATSSE
ncbi:uncharacterized protein F5891DRAFT_1128621 [Suillus fuscotomentosus]|uniref:Uncharacterized protein n=1 Tax=Suillus fuscotomentosus TaxID=1912939 RepID=A0AAD4E889_9AGAM|nr:uncharacterized protein F5891DRAFT_1128621 [Suillus fuscotomentosus]KAG1900153.1 hypothetical protein F5891DRAFT_1128621 [Suillus fuscotomentosus]